MGSFFNVKSKDIDNFFNDDLLFKYCKKCNHKNKKATKFCVECGSNEFYDSLLDFKKATTMYCTKCLSKVEGDICKCGCKEIASADKAFEILNKGVINSKEKELKNIKTSINHSYKKDLETSIDSLRLEHDNKLRTYKDYVKKIEQIENKLETELEKYAVDKHVIIRENDSITEDDIKKRKTDISKLQDEVLYQMIYLDAIKKKCRIAEDLERKYTMRYDEFMRFEKLELGISDDAKEAFLQGSKTFIDVVGRYSALKRAINLGHPLADHLYAKIAIDYMHEIDDFIVHGMCALDKVLAYKGDKHMKKGTYETLLYRILASPDSFIDGKEFKEDFETLFQKALEYRDSVAERVHSNRKR